LVRFISLTELKRLTVLPKGANNHFFFQFLNVESYRASGKRIIPEKELGLAALHQDTTLYTNPLGRRGLGDVFSQSFATQSVYSESQDHTQHVFHTMTPSGRSRIPETQSQKRGREEDEGDDEEGGQSTAGTSKRRCDYY